MSTHAEPTLFLVTVTVMLRAKVPDAPPGQLCDRFMRHDDVVTVRLESAERKVVYRIDVRTDVEEAALEQALAPAVDVAEASTLELDVIDVAAVKDADRIGVFLRTVGGSVP